VVNTPSGPTTYTATDPDATRSLRQSSADNEVGNGVEISPERLITLVSASKPRYKHGVAALLSGKPSTKTIICNLARRYRVGFIGLNTEVSECLWAMSAHFA
jgi:hypothetical protein